MGPSISQTPVALQVSSSGAASLATLPVSDFWLKRTLEMLSKVYVIIKSCILKWGIHGVGPLQLLL